MEIQSAESSQSLRILHFRVDGSPTAVDVVQLLVGSGYPRELIPVSMRKGRQYDRPRNLETTGYTLALSQLIEFATWAFGPVGVPNLELIAFGNFSSEPCRWSRVLLRRDPYGGQRSLSPQWVPNWSRRILGYGPYGVGQPDEYSNPLPFKLIHPDSVYPVIGVDELGISCVSLGLATLLERYHLLISESKASG
jgi:hypothetical protein